MIIPIGLHISDTHLRERQYGFVHRGADFFAAVMEAIEIAKKKKLKFIFHTGDFLNSNRPSASIFAQLRTIHETLIGYGIRMLTISGNHDAGEPSWHSLLEPNGNGGILDMNNLEATYTLAGGEKFSVYGIPFCDNATLLDKLQRLEKPIDIVMWHGMIRDFVGFPAESALQISDLEPFTNAHNFLLGDIHKHQYFAFRSRPGIIGYPGSTEMCESGEDAEKKVGLVYLDTDTRALRIQAEPLSTRPVLFRQIMTDVAANVFIEEVTATKKDKPIFVGRYHPGIPDFITRVSIAKHDDSVMLMTPINGLTDMTNPNKPVVAERPSSLIEALTPGISPELREVLVRCADDTSANYDNYLAEYLQKTYAL